MRQTLDELLESIPDSDRDELCRQVMIMAFNKMLDVDHNTVLREFMQAVEIPMESPLYSHKVTGVYKGRRYMSRLDFISLSCSDMPIIQVCENGVVQRFK